MPSQGPLYPGAVTNLANAGTSENAELWVSPTNVQSDNATEANITAATYDSPDISQILVCSSFGFAIPNGATIDGIVVEIDRRSIIASSGKDFRVQLAKGLAFANLVGNNKAVPATIWPTTSGVASYGGAADLWGATWSEADIEASTFAVFISCQANIANADVGIDFVRVTVYYTESLNRSGGFAQSHGHSAVFSGKKGALAGFAQSHGHTVTASGRKGADDPFAVSHGHTVAFSGRKNAQSGFAVSHGHTAAFSGVAEESGIAFSGSFALSHGGSVLFGGTKHASGGFALSHGHGVGFSGAGPVVGDSTFWQGTVWFADMTAAVAPAPSSFKTPDPQWSAVGALGGFFRPAVADWAGRGELGGAPFTSEVAEYAGVTPADIDPKDSDISDDLTDELQDEGDSTPYQPDPFEPAP